MGLYYISLKCDHLESALSIQVLIAVFNEVSVNHRLLKVKEMLVQTTPFFWLNFFDIFDQLGYKIKSTFSGALFI